MTIPSDSELHQIVQQVVRRTLQRPAGPILAALPDDAIAPPPEVQASRSEAQPRTGVIAIGADHGGYELKEVLKSTLRESGYQIVDCGTHSPDAVDYPDFAAAVARLVSEGEAWRGIVIDGAGIGSAIVANKFPGVRAAMCYDHSTAVNSREHNDANVLTLGAGLVGRSLAGEIVKTWLETDFSGGRHARRVEKISAVERSFLKTE